jgi:serine/threonine protein kinase
LVGTPPYLAPEQLRGERADTRSDLFAVGVLFYELLSGVCPYPELQDEDTRPLLRSMEREEYDPLRRVASGIPRAGARLLRQCLRPKPSRRLASARELRSRLEQLLGCPSPADARSEIAIHLWERSVFRARENQTLVLAPATSAAAKAGGFGWLPSAFAFLLICASILLVDTRPSRPEPRPTPAASQQPAFAPPESAENAALQAKLIATPFDPMLEWIGPAPAR